MRSALNSIWVAVLATSLLAAQSTATKPAPKPAENVPEKHATSTSSNLPSEATVDSFMHQQFGYQADLTWKISSIKPSTITGLAEVNVVIAGPQGQQLTRFYVAPDGTQALVGEIIPFGAKPFDSAKQTLNRGITGPERGPKDAPVTIVEFGDLQCPACKAAQPVIEGLVAAEPNARFVFQNFPLEMHNWAAKGAAYADCVGQASNEAFWKFVAKTYDSQADITAENADEKLTALADGAGVKGTDIAVCAATPVAKAHIDASLALGKAVNVTGTPTLFINGRVIGNLDPRMADVYKGLVDFAAKEGK